MGLSFMQHKDISDLQVWYTHVWQLSRSLQAFTSKYTLSFAQNCTWMGYTDWGASHIGNCAGIHEESEDQIPWHSAAPIDIGNHWQDTHLGLYQLVIQIQCEVEMEMYAPWSQSQLPRLARTRSSAWSRQYRFPLFPPEGSDMTGLILTWTLVTLTYHEVAWLSPHCHPLDDGWEIMSPDVSFWHVHEIKNIIDRLVKSSTFKVDVTP